MAAFVPDRAKFLELAQKGRLCFVYREWLADSETPVSAYAKLGRGPYSFLLESVVGGEKWAAYSFAGVKPRSVIRAKGEDIEILRPEGDGFEVVERRREADPVAYVNHAVRELTPAVPPGLPRFFGGAVGWLGYDVVRRFERLPERAPDELGLPDVCFALTDTVVVFDNLRGTVKVVASVDVSVGDPNRAYDDACNRVEAVIDRIARAAPPLRHIDMAEVRPATAPVSRSGQARFEDGVRAIQEYIKAGDAFQVVLSQRFDVPRAGVDPFDVYRVLRVMNPSPYMYHLEFPEAVVTGASPEVLVRLDGRRLEVRPIAGTRRRGRTPDEDLALEQELREDPKERAEHVMLIDLGRNDVGRVATPASVRLDEVMVVERYSHVMHLVSNVSGTLAEGKGAPDVIRAAFPAGTLSGAPKIRAMEIIEELEPSRRGIYGGAVGYLSYTGNMDFAIAIRTMVTKGSTIHVQAGAGIVAASVPGEEHEESVNKAKVVVTAIEMARNAAGEPEPMLLVIDNYDSFTFNLVQYLAELGQQIRVVRNDELTVEEIAGIAPENIVISPGPGTPNEAGVSLEVIEKLAGKIPILGVCLGHQAIGQAFGGKVIRAKEVVHGKTSRIFHDEKGVFRKLPNPFEATRYHSLVVERATLPDCLEITAKTWDEEIMGLRHKTLPVEGVQFHPESFLTTVGKELLRNFLGREAAVSIELKEALGRLVERKDLTADEMAGVVGRIMDGEATPAQVGALLTALRMKGETVDEVVGAARAMRARMLKPQVEGLVCVDLCGTGGDGSGSVNVSTLASFIVAGSGVPVAKHGNRAMSSKSGSHDVIEALGIDPAPGPELASRCLREAQLCFLFAPAYHAATKHAVGPRRELGFRTFFNLLGPLTNPAEARHHVNGVFTAERCEFLARAHRQLGSARALVVHGAGGLDELAPRGATQVAELHDGQVVTYEVRPADFGLDEADPAGLRGGEPAFNARLVTEVLRGEKGAIRTAALMTAGAALYVTGHAPDLKAATARAQESLDGGRALGVLEALRRVAPVAVKPA